MLNGVDVSEYQPGNIGDLIPYDFLIAQATNGAGYVAPDYRQQVDSALSRGRRAALYHFAEGGSVADELTAFARAYAPYAGHAIPVLDWEGSALNAGPAWRTAYLNAAQGELGVRPLLYGSLSVVGGITGESVWSAAYGSDPVTNGYAAPARTPGVMRQYCSQGRLPGYAGNLDLNAFWGTGADWDALAGTKATPTRKKDRDMLYIYNPTRGGGIIGGALGFYPVDPKSTEALVALKTYGTPPDDGVNIIGGTVVDIATWDNMRQTGLNMGADFAKLVAGALPAQTGGDSSEAIATQVVAQLTARLANG